MPLDLAARAFDVLGLPWDGPPGEMSAIDVHDRLLRGLPASALLTLADRLRVLRLDEVLGSGIGISERTFHRWKKHPPDQPLSPEVSSRLWKFAEVLNSACELFSTQEAAEEWLRRPAMALDGRRPVDLLSTPAGVEAVEVLIGRLKYGVFT